MSSAPKIGSKEEPSSRWTRFVEHILNQPVFFIVLLLAFWIPSAASISILGQHGLFFPLRADFFELFYILGGQSRIVIPRLLLQPSLFLLSWLGPLILIACFILIRKLTRLQLQKWSSLLAFLICCFFIPFAQPGLRPDFLLIVLFNLGIASVLLEERPNGIYLWIVGSLIVFCSFIFQFFKFEILWIIALSVTSFFFHLVFVQKFRLKINSTRKPHILGSYSLGLCLFIFWATSLFFYQTPFSSEKIGYTSWAWLAFLPSILSVLLARLQPEQSALWMRLSAISWGLFFSPQLLPLCLIFIAWQGLLLFRLLMNRWSRTSFFKKPVFQSHFLRPAIVSISLILSLSFGYFKTSSASFPRELSPEWIPTLASLQSPQIHQVLVLGDAIEFLASFSKAHFIQHRDILFETSETQFLKWMEENKVDLILVDRNFMKNQWRDWIKEGRDPVQINRSVLSRLMVYDGLEVETKTLQLEPIQQLKLERIENTSIIQIRKSKDSF